MSFKTRLDRIEKALADRDIANCPPRTLFVVAPGEAVPDRESLPPNCLVIIERIVTAHGETSTIEDGHNAR